VQDVRGVWSIMPALTPMVFRYEPICCAAIQLHLRWPNGVISTSTLFSTTPCVMCCRSNPNRMAYHASLLKATPKEAEKSTIVAQLPYTPGQGGNPQSPWYRGNGLSLEGWRFSGHVASASCVAFSRDADCQLVRPSRSSKAQPHHGLPVCSGRVVTSKRNKGEAWRRW